MTPEQQEIEFIKCARDFKYFASNYIKIRSTDSGEIPFKLYPYQERVLEEFESNRFNIIRKFRQGGLTTLAVLWCLWICMFREHKQILVISKTDAEAIKAGKIAKRALEVLEQTHPWLVPRLAEDSKHTLTFVDTKSEIEFGSKNRARGQTLNYVIIDEAAFIADMEEVWADMYPTVSTGGNVIVVSTVKGMGNWYQKMYHAAEQGKNGFNVINLNYNEHPKYQNAKWVSETKANMGERRFAQEIEGIFLGSGDTYLPMRTLNEIEQSSQEKPVIKKLYKEYDSEKETFEDAENSIDPAEIRGGEGALWIWELPKEGRDYIIGVDAAEGIGSEGDYSSCQVIDMKTLEQVAEFYSNTIHVEDFAMVLSTVGNYYNTALMVVDNFGCGAALLNRIESDINYEYLYHQYSKTHQKPGFNISSKTRPLILENLQNHAMNGTVKIRSRRLVNELNTFVVAGNKRRAEAQNGSHDDLVMALALALFINDQFNKSNVYLDDKTHLSNPKVNKKLNQIKKEIEELSFGIILDKNEDLEELADLIPGVQFPYKRQQDSLLREFGF